MARSNHRAFSSLLASAVAVLLTACANGPEMGSGDPRDPTADVVRSRELHRNQFEDIPVPQGFDYVKEGGWSFGYAQGGVRVGRFRYLGPTPIDEVADFYKRTMGLRAFDWNLVSEGSNDARSVTLDFRKGRQSCRVQVSNLAGRTTINIEVAGSA